ncbi:type I DNA topoisomerase [Actinomyces procaprae]|uniref:type I DNA topoisomerase n=1 Tax=Actinomyces procaprae TaxID=2560010 RepID=UPI00109D9DE2|nr:type I DNA topoisomerase [Actinomyces procaprae]
MSKKLVIVESPNKVRSIAGYLGKDFDVEASVGHIRDLAQPSELPAAEKKGPYGRFAVDVTDGFKPYYVVNPDKKKTVTQLRKALKDADELYLATDDDREGEAIAWHLLEVLKPKVPVRRMTFTEITKEAVTRALDNTRDLDTHRVDAQETRRILDRLVGYEVSPVLWRKVRAGLSAGRVQSVATRLVVERERERMAFKAAGYWGVEARLSTDLAAGGSLRSPAGDDSSFTARLTALDGRRVATGRDFTDAGVLRPAAVKAGTVHLHEGAARAVADAIIRAVPRVAEVEDKPYRRRPAAPFTTSTLQQEASRKLRMNPRETMRVAQALYENGFITYMRTDSTVLSGQAVAAARGQVAELYGPEYVAPKPRVYATKTKGAQEAHEAIRPAGDHFRTPAQVSGRLTGPQFRLYELIWRRTVASQMADATGSTATVRVDVPLRPADGGSRDAGITFNTASLSAAGTVITFRGFLAAYEEGRDADRYESEAAPAVTAAAAGGAGDGVGRSGAAGAVKSGKDRDVRLPAMIVGQELSALAAEAAGHETTPPPRYTEASLVKALEEREIGRPSTYASIMSTISDRGYVEHRGQALVPTWLAFAVTRLLEENFSELVDYDFTASMEADLDRIAAGEEDRVDWLTQFYYGPQGRAGVSDAAPSETGTAGESQGLKALVDGLGEIDARAVNSIDIGEGITLRVGRYGPYLEDAEGKRANVPGDLAPDELTVAKARELFTRAADDGRELGADPSTGHTIVAKDGRYGPYVTEILPEPETAPEAEEGVGTTASKPGGRATARKSRKGPKPRTASLLKSMDLATVTLEQALDLLSLPRVVGQDGEGVDITAQNGRYGPYLKKGTDSRSLESEEQLFTVTLEQALELFAQPKRRRGQAAARGPLRELGTDPATGRPVVIKDGRFGPYFTDGETNVTLRRDDDPATVTPERAYELLAEKRAKGPAKKRTTRKTTTKKTTAKKAATGKSAR